MQEEIAVETLTAYEESSPQLAGRANTVFWITTFPQQQVLSVSPMYPQLWGFDAHDLYADFAAWRSRIHPEDQQRIGDAYLATLTHPQGHYNVEYRSHAPDGRVYWVHDQRFPVRDATGKIYCIVGIAEDITVRKQVEEALRTVHNELQRRVEERTAALSLTNLLLQKEIAERQRTEESLRASEERFRLMALATNDAFYDWDIRSGSVWRNEGFHRVFGAPAGEDFAWWVKHLHPDDRTKELVRVNAALAGNDEILRHEYRFQRASGEYAFVLDCGYIVRDPAGKPVRMIGALTDITERKQAEDALRASEEQYRNLFENANDGILTSTLEGVVTSINRGVERILGRPREDIIGQRVDKFLTPTSFAVVQDRTQRFLAGEKPSSATFELELIHADGHLVPIEARTRAVRDQQGSPIGFQGIVRDITERKQAEAAVLAERTRLAREIHDTLAQGFTGIILQLEAAKSALLENPERAHVRLGEALALARESLAEARRSVWALRPHALEQGDLPNALIQLTARAMAGTSS